MPAMTQDVHDELPLAPTIAAAVLALPAPDLLGRLRIGARPG
jgi:hypothetical protein